MIETLKDDIIASISAGSAHSACINQRGDVFVFGNGIYGQMGNGKKENSYIPIKVPNLELCRQVASGLNHIIAFSNLGKVYGWGAGSSGRLGIKSEADQTTPQNIALLNDKTVRSIAAGGCMSMAVCSHQWVPDKDAVACMHCKSKFTFINRRHHWYVF